MKIEDFWLDGTIYSIQFKSKHLNYTVTRSIILPKELEDIEIEKLIYTKFYNVTEIVSISELGDCLIDKLFQYT